MEMLKRPVPVRALSNVYKHPRASLFGRLVERIANSIRLAKVRRAIASRLPFPKMASDVKDVVYLTWLVPVEACEGLVPAGVRLWQRDGLTPFTVLTYRHTHFGPSMLKLFRRLFPSPLQSNWRLYLDQPSDGVAPVRTVLFLKNIMDSLAYSLATRVLSDALLTHLAARFDHCRTGDIIRTEIAPGEGSSPALMCTVRCGNDRALSPHFASTFGSWSTAVEFLAYQDAAVSHVENLDRLAFAEINLPIDVTEVLSAQPLGAPPTCSMLSLLTPVDGPMCFVVPSVRFQALSERLLMKCPSEKEA